MNSCYKNVAVLRRSARCLRTIAGDGLEKCCGAEATDANFERNHGREAYKNVAVLSVKM